MKDFLTLSSLFTVFLFLANEAASSAAAAAKASLSGHSELTLTNGRFNTDEVDDDDDEKEDAFTFPPG